MLLVVALLFPAVVLLVLVVDVDVAEGRSSDASYDRAMRSASGTSSISSRSKQDILKSVALGSASVSGLGVAMMIVICFSWLVVEVSQFICLLSSVVSVEVVAGLLGWFVRRWQVYMRWSRV